MQEYIFDKLKHQHVLIEDNLDEISNPDLDKSFIIKKEKAIKYIAILATIFVLFVVYKAFFPWQEDFKLLKTKQNELIQIPQDLLQNNIYNLVDSSKLQLFETYKYESDADILANLSDTKRQIKANLILRDSIYAYQKKDWQKSKFGRDFIHNTKEMQNSLELIDEIKSVLLK